MPGETAVLASVNKELGELERAEAAVLLRDLCPDEHGGFGQSDLPSGLVEAFDEDVAAQAVDVADLGDALLRALQARRSAATWMGVKVP